MWKRILGWLRLLGAMIARSAAWAFRNSKELLATLSLLVVFAIFWYFYTLAKLGVMEDLNVPEELGKQGYSGSVVAHRLLDGMERIRSEAGEESGERFSSDAAPKDSLKLLETELPVKFIVEMVRHIFNLPISKIGGDVVAIKPAGYVITLRVDSKLCAPRQCLFQTSSPDLEAGMAQLSLMALKKVDPYNLAVYDLRKRQTADAYALIPDFMREDEVSEADRYNVKGGILMRMGKGAEAEEAYNVALKKDARNPSPYFNLGDLRRQEGKFEEAVNDYRSAVKRQEELKPDDPKAADLYAGLASGYRDQARDLTEKHSTEQAAKASEEAERSYRKALALDENNPRAYAGWGDLLQDEGKIAEAKALYEKALALDANFSQAMFGVGECLRREGRAKEAAEMYKKVIKVAEKDSKYEKLARQQLKIVGEQGRK